MKVELVNNKPDELLIIYETDFEEDYLRTFFRGNLTAYLKYGVSLDTLMGIKIQHNFTKKEEK